MKKLTVIIPFLNEGGEIKATLESIYCYLNTKIDIILINDASTDGYDYETVATYYGAKYIVNTKRMGVAASRDIGVQECKTPYFLLLDGHMRFYDNKWVKTIVSELEKDERVLLCCQTKVLRNKNGEVVEGKSSQKSYAAAIDLIKNVLLANWTYQEREPESPIESVPCVLGAAYAMSKKYWTYLKGLQGLIKYGIDEAYISTKVWLEGGKCKLLKNVVIGHIYRDKSPYVIENFHMLYNKLFIAEVLFPPLVKDYAHEKLKQSFPSVYPECIELLKENRNQIDKLKTYYEKIFTQNFDLVIKNNLVSELPVYKEDVLYSVFSHFLLNLNYVSCKGIAEGKMGMTIFFMHYAKIVDDSYPNEIAEKILEIITESLYKESPIEFGKGLMGIVWGIRHLSYFNFIEADTSEILEDIDKLIIEKLLSEKRQYLKENLKEILNYTLISIIDLYSKVEEGNIYKEYFNVLNEICLSVYDNQLKHIQEKINFYFDYLQNQIYNETFYSLKFLLEKDIDNDFTSINESNNILGIKNGILKIGFPLLCNNTIC